ncbi:MAG: hypothetical protein CVV49_01130 [Spirochaetae bacterium HGW-Spirochaetae-5]|nr:MAG: hypothetical protein CVV49_01130 [Spirochaetae bacterium HGW-Spirochaetae-5]
MLMSKRSLYTLGIIFFLGSAIVVKNWSCSSVPSPEGWYEPADEIIVTGKDVSLNMTKKESKWFINEQSYAGDADLIEALERKARDFKLLDLVSDKGYYDKYDLTEDRAVTIFIKGKGKVLRKIAIGKAGSTKNHSYIRVDDSKEVYLASGIMKSDFNLSVSDLRDKRIFDIKKEDIRFFRISYGGENYDFQLFQNKKETDGSDGNQKSLEKWMCRGYKDLELSDAEVNSILALFSPLKAAEFPENADVEKSGKLVCIVTIPYSDKNFELEIYNSKENDMHYARTNVSEYVFTLGAWQTEKLFIKDIYSLSVK